MNQIHNAAVTDGSASCQPPIMNQNNPVIMDLETLIRNRQDALRGGPPSRREVFVDSAKRVASWIADNGAPILFALAGLCFFISAALQAYVAWLSP